MAGSFRLFRSVTSKGTWAKIESDRNFSAGRSANEVSLLWDRLIDSVTRNFIDGTLEVGNEIEIPDFERVARIMASENRFHRRVLCKAIFERAEKAQKGRVGSLLPSGQLDVVYALLIGRGAPIADYPEYRADRSRELQLRCIAAKAAMPSCRYIIGIALDALGVRGSSEDFVFMDTAGWDDQTIARAESMRADLGFYVKGVAVESRMIEDEYPRS